MSDPLSTASCLQRGEELFDAGDLYGAGLCFEEIDDTARAFLCYTLGAERGRTRRAECLLQLGYCARFGTAPATSAAVDKEEQAFAHFVAAAEAAAEARTQELDDVDSDADRVADLEEIEGEASYCVGACLEDGTGVVADEAAAARWYERGVELQHGGCCHSLGAMFLRGSPAAAAAASSASGSATGSVPKDEARAAELFATGVALDSTECILALAMCYLRAFLFTPSGTGVVQNLQRARDLLELGVEAGDVACQKQLASFAFELIAAGGETSGSKD